MPKLINEKHAAKIIGKSVSWLQKDRSSTRKIPYIRIGKSIRYDIDDLFRVIAENRIPACWEVTND